MSKTACLNVLARTGLLGRVLITPDLEESVGNTEAHCSVESACVMIPASASVSDKMDAV